MDGGSVNNISGNSAIYIAGSTDGVMTIQGTDENGGQPLTFSTPEFEG